MLLATEDTGRGDHGYTAGGDGRSTHAMAAPMIRCGERKKNSQTKLLLHAFIAPGPGFRVQFCPCAIALRASFLPVCSGPPSKCIFPASVQRILQNSAYSGAKLAEKTQKNAEKETFARTEGQMHRCTL